MPLTLILSRSSRARGLKPLNLDKIFFILQVALFTGAWIETSSTLMRKESKHRVALFTGAWIETFVTLTEEEQGDLSRSSRARGLKQQDGHLFQDLGRVALFTGAWIETYINGRHLALLFSRALHGRVD